MAEKRIVLKTKINGSLQQISADNLVTTDGKTVSEKIVQLEDVLNTKVDSTDIQNEVQDAVQTVVTSGEIVIPTASEEKIGGIVSVTPEAAENITDYYVSVGNDGRAKISIPNSRINGENTFRAIKIGGVDFLGEEDLSALDFIAGDNIIIEPDNNTKAIKISAIASGIEVPKYEGSETIEVQAQAENGNYMIDIKDNSIEDKHIKSVDINKLIQTDGETVVFDGGYVREIV